MFHHVRCVYVWQIYEKFGSSMCSFSWFGQKVNKFEVKGYRRHLTAPEEPNSKMFLRYHLPLAVRNRYIMLFILENLHHYHLLMHLS